MKKSKWIVIFANIFKNNINVNLLIFVQSISWQKNIKWWKMDWEVQYLLIFSCFLSHLKQGFRLKRTILLMKNLKKNIKKMHLFHKLPYKNYRKFSLTIIN